MATYTTTSDFISPQPDLNLHLIRTTPASSSTTASTLIFLHFWGGSANTWTPVIAHLALHVPTIALDFRGWGQSTGPDDADAYSIGHLASDVEAVIKHYDLQNVILVGHSMGGKVAQLLAGRGTLPTGILRGVILVGPAPPTPFSLPGAMRDEQISAFDTPESAEYVTRNVLSAGGLDDQTVKNVVGDMLKFGKWARLAWPGYAMEEDVSDAAGKIAVPVRVLAGGKDVVEPVERIRSELGGYIKGVEVVVVEGVGHLLLLEAPERVGHDILEFVKGMQQLS